MINVDGHTSEQGRIGVTVASLTFIVIKTIEKLLRNRIINHLGAERLMVVIQYGL